MDYVEAYEKVSFLLKILYFTLFLLAVIGTFTQFLQFLFVCNLYFNCVSLFSVFSSVSIVAFGITWGLLRAITRNLLKPSKGLNLKEVIKEYFRICFRFIGFSFRFIGFRRPRPKDFLYLLIGGAINAYIIFVIRGAPVKISLQNLLMMESLFVILLSPLVEEVIFRGIYLSTIEEIYGRNYRAVTIGLIFSSFTFGRIHTDPFPILLTKILPGFILGAIYLFKWRRNLVAALLTHMGANIVGVLAT